MKKLVKICPVGHVEYGADIIDLNIIDNEGNVVDGTTSELSHDQISDIIDHAAQLVLMARDDEGDWGGLISKPRDCSQILTELEDALITANVISESKHALAEVIVTLFPEDGKCIILGFTKKGEKILDQRETPAGESEDHTRKAVFTNKDVQVPVDGQKWRDIEKGGRLKAIIEAMLSNATYAKIYALIHNSEPTCTCNHMQPGSVCRRYDDKDGKDPVYSFGRYNKLGDFCPDKSVDLSGGRYDLADDSDTCLICAEQI